MCSVVNLTDSWTLYKEERLFPCSRSNSHTVKGVKGRKGENTSSWLVFGNVEWVFESVWWLSTPRLSMDGASFSRSRTSVVNTELSALSDLEFSVHCQGFLCVVPLTSVSQFLNSNESLLSTWRSFLNSCWMPNMTWFSRDLWVWCSQGKTRSQGTWKTYGKS